MLILYNILLVLYFIITLPYYALQMLRREKYRAGLRQRLGLYPETVKARLGKGKTIWVHAVSVGEVNAVTPLVRRLIAEMTEFPIVLSTVTLTGQKVARDKFGDSCAVIYFPLDFRFAVRRALELANPALVVLAETELWPNFIREAAARRIPVAVVNGRISDRSFRGYRRLRMFLRPLLQSVTRFGMQAERHARRIVALGATPEKVTITGNMKFDCGLMPCSESQRREVAASLGLRPEQQVIVAGSTHSGEEEILLDVFLSVRGGGDGTALVIAPRHPERAAEVAALAEEKGERCTLRSRLGTAGARADYSVLVVDTVGELANIYRCATVVFVGKSLVGGGGQNVIEPASLGKPVLFGPSMHNFREAAALLLKRGGAIQVKNAGELRSAIASLLADPARREEMGRRAAEAMGASRGATQRNLQIINEILSRPFTSL